MRFQWRRAVACLVLVFVATFALAQSLTIGDLNKNIGDHVNKDVTVKGVISDRGENPDVLGDLKNRFVLSDPTTNETLEVLTNSSVESIPKIGEPFEASGTVKLREGNIIYMESRGGLNLLLVALVALGGVACVLIYLILFKPQKRLAPVSSGVSQAGTGFKVPPPEVMATCPHCGSQTPVAKPFCKECGKPLTDPPKPPPPGPDPEGPTRPGGTRADHVVAILTLNQGNVIGKTRGSHVEMKGKELWLGRDAKLNSVVMPEDNVSKRHAKLEVTGTDVHLVDQESTNGTFVNSTRITDQVLADGDEIRIGDNVFVFRKTSPAG